MSVYPRAAVTQLTVAELPENVTIFLFYYLICKKNVFQYFFYCTSILPLLIHNKLLAILLPSTVH